MATTVAKYDSSGCLTSFGNGADGQVLQIVNGEPTWTTLAITCEDIQDCIGQGTGPSVANTGIYYDDATNTFSFRATQLPALTGAVTGFVATSAAQPNGAVATPLQAIAEVFTAIGNGSGLSYNATTPAISFNAASLTDQTGI